jgi:hypothetical protein
MSAGSNGMLGSRSSSSQRLLACARLPASRLSLFARALLARHDIFSSTNWLVVMFHSVDARYDRLLTNALPTQTSGAGFAAKLLRSERVHPSDSFQRSIGEVATASPEFCRLQSRAGPLSKSHRPLSQCPITPCFQFTNHIPSASRWPVLMLGFHTMRKPLVVRAVADLGSR